MFHAGDLQSGIALAIQSAKSVACFVTDGSNESITWEEQWLSAEEIRTLFEKHAVLLKLEAGSQEAGFLAAFCPLKEVPALVIIHNGQLKEHIAIPVEQDQFTSRVKAALGGAAAVPTSNDTAASNELHTSGIASEEPQNSQSGESATSSPAPQSSDTSSSAPASRTPQQILAEYQARQAAEKQQRQQAQQERLRAEQLAQSQGKGKQREDADERERAEEAKRQQTIAAEQAKKRKKEQDAELARVKARIEADKKARKAEAETRRREREQAKAESEGVQSTSSRTVDSPNSGFRGSAIGKDVQIQVRLFDGSTVRSTFPSSTTLAASVRPWIDSVETAPFPYTFRHIQAPLPSRELTASDESVSLADIELCPSATLLVIPVLGKTSSAYESAAYNTGYLGSVQQGVSGAFGLVGSVVGAIGGALSKVAGFGGDGTQDQPPSGSQRRVQPSTAPGGSAQQASGSSIKVRTLADQRRETKKDDTELYNGNQLNFEPRDDDK